MRKSVVMAMSASILLTGCLVKKSDYEAEQGAHAATQQKLAEVGNKLTSAQAKLQAETKAVQDAKKELSAVRAQLASLHESVAIMEEVLDSKNMQAKTAETQLRKLEKKVGTAEAKVSKAKELLNKRVNEVKSEADAKLVELNAQNAQLRKFMMVNFSNADFHYVDPAEIVVPVEEPVADMIVEKSAVEGEPVASIESVNEEVAETTVTKNKWWKFWGKKSPKVSAVESSFDLDTYQKALNAMDQEAAAKEAMRMMDEVNVGEVTALSRELMTAAIATDDVGIIKWVSVGIVKGPSARQDVVKSVISELLEGTSHEKSVAELLEL